MSLVLVKLRVTLVTFYQLSQEESHNNSGQQTANTAAKRLDGFNVNFLSLAFGS